MSSGPISPVEPYRSTASELKQRLAAERTSLPHLVYRDASGAQVVTGLDRDAIAIGRHHSVSICLSWDSRVSRVHAELQRIEDVWTLIDDGLSRNGSFVNGQRVGGRQRLEDGDLLTFGSTTLLFRAPGPRYESTEAAKLPMSNTIVAASERCVLVALCRPIAQDRNPSPATNREIAEELCISVPAVKRRLGLLFVRFGLARLPHNQKRARLAEAAMRTRLVSRSDF